VIVTDELVADRLIADSELSNLRRAQQAVQLA
jgi:hypothetical protein